MEEFSYTKGYYFLFQDEDIEIKAWFSTFSGLEKIFVNGEFVSKQRNLSTSSGQVFNISGDEYQTQMQVKNFFKGPYVCTLFKNGIPIKRKKLCFFDGERTKKPFFLRIWFFLLLGALFGFISALFSFPKWTFGVFFIAIFVAVHSYNKYNKLNNIRPKIVDDEV